MSRPTVLLISPGILRWTDQDFGLPHLVSIGGWLERETGVRVEILDLGYEGGDHRSLARTIEGLGPLLCVGLSAYSSFDYRRVMSVARFLRELLPDVPLIGGGYHASALPLDLVFEGSPFTTVVQGEGELPMTRIVQTLLGGGQIERVYRQELIQELDTLPPYRWDLLARYWPRAKELGRKLQIYLSRGCPYHCTFCMERSKSGYQWRAYTAERALDELRRLARQTDLSHWVVNVADPLFGFHRRWRRTVLEGVIREQIFPRQYWTLTRSDDLDDEDVSLLARARFSIGIGLESGSPRMLKLMQKGNEPGAYLGALLRLSELSRTHGLSWAANVIVGHPGEDAASMRETRAYLERLYLSAPETCGWLSVDPFRLYPGADVHERLGHWEEQHGARFYHPAWWRRWYDGGFYAQHLDPSATLSYAERVTYMYEAYPPLVAEVQQRFRGQGRSIDRVFERSLAEQTEMYAPEMRDRLLRAARRAEAEGGGGNAAVDTLAHRPLGLQLRDPWVRRREEAVRRLLEAGVLRTERVIDALLEVGPERFLAPDVAEAVLSDRTPAPAREGEPGEAPGIGTLALALEVMGLGAGDHAADLLARSGWVTAVLAELVGESGVVYAYTADPSELALGDRRNVQVILRDPASPWVEETPVDGAWLGAALPRVPHTATGLLAEGGRLVTAVGPRFRPQDLVVYTRHGDAEVERVLARVRLPSLGGHAGWVPAVRAAGAAPVTVGRWPAPARAFEVFARLDLGDDAATCFDPTLPAEPWAPALAAAWGAAPGRLALIGAALRHVTVGELCSGLRARPPAALADPPGRLLASLFADAIEHLDRAALAPAARPTEPPSMLGDIAALRALVWEANPVRLPPLLLLDCPALGTRARATTHDGARRVALSLGAPAAHVVMQVLHEEIHVLTDPIVYAEWGDTSDDTSGDTTSDTSGDTGARPYAERDTRVGSAGWALHEELEEVAIAATDALLRAKAPAWVPAFEAWLGGLTRG